VAVKNAPIAVRNASKDEAVINESTDAFERNGTKDVSVMNECIRVVTARNAAKDLAVRNASVDVYLNKANEFERNEIKDECL
jgi:FixJ family two-component response regulator